MRIGLQVPSFTFPGGPERIAAEFGRIAREADRGGLASLWVMDHLFQIQSVGPAEEPMLEGYSALAYAAALTEDITLGTMVTGVSYRSPALLVKTVTTLDVLSGGRAWLGVGAAWNEEESRGLGLHFPPTAERFELLEDTLRLAHQMWKGDESAFEGRRISAERPLNSPPAVRRPHPPILVGGMGEKKTLRFVAKYADACNIFDGEHLPHKLQVLREHCEREGRDYAEIEKTSLTVLPDTASAGQAVDTAGRLADAGVDHVIFSQRTGQDLAGVLAEARAETDKIVPAGR
ncbi:TIGR03560 family F420-dependent LLM class oxidoreductase [Actinomadura logoneensis]|uniref:TIGR03560 family F420-dependent LLM class oxidoreductase n=1 Tax=Actinomadura logoneensis TaxID=2293572 RepID=A0A372JB12_9ACTN|nr:TIGR03560 family F420-dependent LLM class oxidoreductase [Actinomadura logoneensis]RFU37109.1 TIGR03560 family F420-dependent LLM class oxidoreductase [Actinomadura logoneensis]